MEGQLPKASRGGALLIGRCWRDPEKSPGRWDGVPNTLTRPGQVTGTLRSDLAGGMPAPANLRSEPLQTGGSSGEQRPRDRAVSLRPKEKECEMSGVAKESGKRVSVKATRC